MTEQHFAAGRRRVLVLVGAGIAAFVGAYTFNADTIMSSRTSLIFVISGLICFVVAGKIAKDLTKEIASK